MNRVVLYHISKRFTGSGIFGHNNQVSLTQTAKLEKMVQKEVQRLAKRDRRRNKRPAISMHFHDSEEMIQFKKSVLKRLNELKKQPILAELDKEWGITFSDAKVDNKLTEVVIMWRAKMVKTTENLGVLNELLMNISDEICNELNADDAFLQAPKIIFTEDYYMKNETFMTLFDRLDIMETVEGIEELETEKDSDNGINYAEFRPDGYANNVLRFDRDSVMDKVCQFFLQYTGFLRSGLCLLCFL